MSEVEARPPPSRGRSTTRGGRGGFGRGGPRGGRKPVNGTSTESAPVNEESLDDQGEIGEMKKKYASELGMLKDMFPDWTDVDLVFALQETDGDLPATVEKITEGNVSQFSEVKKVKDRARSKVKDEPAMAGVADRSTTRGGRGRGGYEGARGGRARGSDRGRGGLRGARGGHATTNGAPKETAAISVPTTESSAWDTTTSTEAAEGTSDPVATEATKEPAADGGQSAWADVMTSEATPATASEGMKSSLIPEGGAKKSWASMFSQPKPVPAAAKQPTTTQPPPRELVASGQIPAQEEEAVEEHKEPVVVPSVPALEEPVQASELARKASPVELPTSTEAEELAITPSKDPLTEENVEHLPDESIPPATQTVASTAGSMDPRNLTPLPNQQAPIGRPPVGGYAMSAYRATGQPGRSASYQRRVQEQQEAVVMPGHNAVDRAAVQFGSMGINGESGMDVDVDREEPETQKALQHSPPSQPRTSLPPAPRQASASQEGSMMESLPTPKQAPGLPPASTQNQQQMQEAAMASGLGQDHAQMNQGYGHYGRYSQPGMQHDSAVQQQQKPYDPFSHQAQSSQYEQYGSQQAPQQQQQQQQSQSGFGALSSAPNDYSNYYTSSEQQRNAYNQYYGSSYGQQDTRGSTGQQETGMGQQRSASGFGALPTESAYSSQAQQQVSNFDFPETMQQVDEYHGDGRERSSLLGEMGCAMMSSSLQLKPVARRLPVMSSKVAEPADMGVVVDSPLHGKLQRLEYIINCESSLPSPHTPSINISNITFKQAQSRFGEAPGSGHNTPNPLMGGQHQSAASQQQSQLAMQQGQQGQQQPGGQQGGQQQQHANYGTSASFPYGHPYYNSPYQQAYQAQFGYSQPVSNYGGSYPPGKQGGMYGAPQGYGMSSQSAYEQHSASPANAGAFGQNQQGSMRSASGMNSSLSGGLEDYGRSATQPASHQQGSGFGGGMNDPFARSTSGFGGQSGYGQQSMGGGPDDSLKAFNDAKSGPSPAIGQPGRPGSAANNPASSSQSGLPPPQGHQSGFGGGYAGFPGQGSQYGGLGGLGSHQQQAQSGMGGQGGYGGYGAGGFNQTYGGYGSRGGWGTNYGAH